MRAGAFRPARGGLVMRGRSSRGFLGVFFYSTSQTDPEVESEMFCVVRCFKNIGSSANAEGHLSSETSGKRGGEERQRAVKERAELLRQNKKKGCV